MFGKPKFSDAPFLLRELSDGMAATANAMELEHPDATSTDTQAITVWVFAIILHAVLMWGRTDEETVAIIFQEFGSMMQQNTADGAWSLDQLSSEVERCQRLLTTHASSLNYEGVKEAASGYYRGLTRFEPKPTLAEDDFLRFAVTTFLANVTRLKDSGYIKLK